MPRPSRLIAPVALGALVIASGVWTARAYAEVATPAGASDATLILIEHADLVTEIDLGEPGPSVGDMLVWGPNALYDEADVKDTGATTQGTCIAFNANADCLAAETILFPDGSTLEFQGIERGGARSTRTIVGGSGRYLGAAGTMTAIPSADLMLWTKTIRTVFPGTTPGPQERR
jgi:3D (Asp-Asp-Asp) domain-containing protein